MMAFTMRSYSPRSTMCVICNPMFFFFLHVLLFSMRIQVCSGTGSDCLIEGSSIPDNSSGSGSALVSQGNVFEFGFFTPDGSSSQNRYLGIWYYNESDPKIVVWVANRDTPLLESNGYLIIQDGKAELLNSGNRTYWSTDSNSFNVSFPNDLGRLSYVHTSSSSPRIFGKTPPPSRSENPTGYSINATRLCLHDNGNLILDDRRMQGDPILWQSFQHPTDTVLPGMSTVNTYGNLNFTSWQTHNEPAQGNFTMLLQPGETDDEIVITETGVVHYWESGTTLFDDTPKPSEILVHGSSLCATTRLVMNFSGHVQFWKRDCERNWFLIWSQPKDRCSLYNTCGNFGSCNSNNGLSCKCLPGFKPSTEWISGDTSGGCSPISGRPSDRNGSSNDIFLKLPMMNVGNQLCAASTSVNCTAQCLEDNSCVAYYYGNADCKGTSHSNENQCLTWSDELSDLQEDYGGGITLYLRTTTSDIESTPRDCSPCGTYIIPYPLSTAATCGDSSYSNFHCNAETGQVNFSTPNGAFKVNLIDPVAKIFYIQVQHANSCESRYIDSLVLSPQDSLPFTVRNCNVVNDQPLIDIERPFIEVEIGWQPAPEIACDKPSDCNSLRHTTCKSGSGGKMRCFCGRKFHWDGLNLKCKRVHFPLKVVASCIGGALSIILLCGMIYIYLIHKGRKAERQDTMEFQGDETEGIDVPFFDWGSILAATDNFAQANKLGTGGFGSVYRGKLSDGKQIAVKRLSSVSVQGVEEFRTEVVLIAKLQHRNLVRLLGYCVKAEEKILLYEYMPNGSLDTCLFDDTSSVHLDWEKRFSIIFGIARGLLYLHQDSRLRIIHRDLKPSNILLDEDLNPKISDFGIARIVEGKDTEASTAKVVGTYGYMSPEYAYEGLFSVKSDVFSFGVVVLETLCGRRNSKIFMLEHGRSLLGHAWRLWGENRGMDLIDQTLTESCNASEVLMCIHIGLLCVQEDPSDRPTMSTVVLMLSSKNASLPSPNQPAFSTTKPPSDNASSSSAVNSSFSDVITVSTVGR